MPLKKKPKRVEQLVGLMRDPDPVFVSIVDHGANQTPFAVVKRDKQGAIMPIVNRRKGDKPVREQKGAAKNIGVRKLVFDTDLYPDTEAVSKYLTDNDWSGYSIKRKGAFFEAAAKDTNDAAFVSLREIDVVEGITAYVGELKATGEQKAVKKPTIPTKQEEVDPDHESEIAADTSDEDKGTADAPDMAPYQGEDEDGDKSQDPHANDPDRPDDETESAADDGDADHREDPGNMGVNPVVPPKKAPQTPDEYMATDPVIPEDHVKPDHGPEEMRHDPEIPEDSLKPIQVPLTDKSSPTYNQPTELASKYDQWFAMFSKDTDVTSVVKEGMKDGLPPGIMEVTSAMMTAMANTFLSAEDSATKKATVAKIGAEYATLANGLYDVFEALGATEKKSVKAKGADFTAGFKAFVAENADRKPAAKSAANVRKASGATEAEVIANAISQAMGGFASQLQDSLKALSSKVDAASRDAKEAVKLSKTAAKTVEDVAAAAPIKKGHNGDFYDLDPAATKGKSDDADEAFQRRTTRNLFGL